MHQYLVAEELVGDAGILSSLGDRCERRVKDHLRRHEDLGLIYTVGRSPAGYRLFDEVALGCVAVIQELRSLGLTEAEIQHLADLHADACPIGPRLAEILGQVRARTEARIRELEQLRSRVERFEHRHRATLDGRSGANPWSDHDPNWPRA